MSVDLVAGTAYLTVTKSEVPIWRQSDWVPWVSAGLSIPYARDADGRWTLSVSYPEAQQRFGGASGHVSGTVPISPTVGISGGVSVNPDLNGGTLDLSLVAKARQTGSLPVDAGGSYTSTRAIPYFDWFANKLGLHIFDAIDKSDPSVTKNNSSDRDWVLSNWYQLKSIIRGEPGFGVLRPSTNPDYNPCKLVCEPADMEHVYQQSLGPQ